MSAAQQTIQQKRRQEIADKQAMIKEITRLASIVVASTQHDEWQTQLRVREQVIVQKYNHRNELVDGKEYRFNKRPALPIDEAKCIYLTDHKDIVEPVKQPNGRHKPHVDTECYRPINWQIRNLTDLTGIHAELLARANTQPEASS